MRNYLSRIKIPLNGEQNTIFFTKSKLRIAQGYNRIFIEKKPIIEFSIKNIVFDNIIIPFHLQWKINNNSDYIEYRSKDYCKIKINYCKKKEKFYCCLLDLTGSGLSVFVEKRSIERKTKLVF